MAKAKWKLNLPHNTGSRGYICYDTCLWNTRWPLQWDCHRYKQDIYLTVRNVPSRRASAKCSKPSSIKCVLYLDGLVKWCGASSVLTMDILQSYSKPPERFIAAWHMSGKSLQLIIQKLKYLYSRHEKYIIDPVPMFGMSKITHIHCRLVLPPIHIHCMFTGYIICHK